MNKLSKDKRDKLILIVLGTVMVLGLLYTFVLGVQKDELFTLNAKILSTKDRLSKAERLVRASEVIEADLAERRKEVSAREQGMAPPNDAYSWFLQLLANYNQSQKLRSITIVDITQPEISGVGLLPKFPYQAAVFSVRLTGRFAEIGRFIADFENRFPYLRVENLHLQQDTLGAISAALNSSGQPESDQKLLLQMKVVALMKPNAT